MRLVPIALTVILSVLSIAGQEQRVSISNFPAMVTRGLKAIDRGPHRYTTSTEQYRTITREIDANGSIRTKSLNIRTGESGECVIIGQRIYHRSSGGSWASQTREEYERAQVTIAAAVKEARARKDTATHKKLLSGTLNNLAIFYTLFSPAGPPLTALSARSEKTIVFLGNLPYKDKVASFYRFVSNTPEFPPPSKDVRALRTEILYAFDAKTGALLKAETRQDWIYKSEQKTSFTTDEWEPDPTIVITAPVIEDLSPLGQ